MTVFGVIVGAYVMKALESGGGPAKRPDGRAEPLQGFEGDGAGARARAGYDPRAAIAGEGRYRRRY